jgi:hypothetical protein
VKKILFKSNDQVIEVFGLKNVLTGAFLNAATVTATLKNRSGQNVAGLTDLPLNYVAGSNGDYRGQVEETFNPPQRDGYTLIIDAAEGGLVGHWEFPARVEARQE